VHVVRLEDYPKEPRFSATILSTERITDKAADVEVRELVLQVDARQFDIEIGQYIGVLSEGPSEFGGSVHHRLYTVADTPSPETPGKSEIAIVVRRCNYIDDYSGEEYLGISSNYICDRAQGDRVMITGPFGSPFAVPRDKSANLLLIALGTGIAPFRGLLKHIYQELGGWTGKVRLLYGAHSSLELLYMNNARDDIATYFEEDTFEAIRALSPRPDWAEPIAWDDAVAERAGEIWNMVSGENSYVYVSGLTQIRDPLDELFIGMCGSADDWAKKKAELIETGRWVELLY
jgi:ferredoxin--NADP+ reductase